MSFLSDLLRNLFGGSDKKDEKKPDFFFHTDGTKDVRDTIHIREPGEYNFHNVLHVWKGPGKMEQREYQKPILHVHVSGVTIIDFAYKNSPEGVHVGALDWTASNARKKHRKISGVRFVRMQSLNIGEDACTLQNNVHDVKFIKCKWKGNRGGKKGGPGTDKAVQNDNGREILFEDCEWKDCVRAVRCKSNTITEFNRCKFIDCSYGVRADGDYNPNKQNPFAGGSRGKAVVVAKDTIMWGGTLASASYNSHITLINCKAPGGKMKSTERGGKVTIK